LIIAGEKVEMNPASLAADFPRLSEIPFDSDTKRMLVDISAVRQGMPDLAFGDLFGSSLMNLLILAVLDLAHRVSVFPKL